MTSVCISRLSLAVVFTDAFHWPVSWSEWWCSSQRHSQQQQKSYLHTAKACGRKTMSDDEENIPSWPDLLLIKWPVNSILDTEEKSIKITVTNYKNLFKIASAWIQDETYRQENPKARCVFLSKPFVVSLLIVGCPSLSSSLDFWSFIVSWPGQGACLCSSHTGRPTPTLVINQLWWRFLSSTSRRCDANINNLFNNSVQAQHWA